MGRNKVLDVWKITDELISLSLRTKSLDKLKTLPLEHGTRSVEVEEEESVRKRRRKEGGRIWREYEEEQGSGTSIA